MNWLNTQRFDQPAHGLVIQELLLAARHAKERLERADDAIIEVLPTWSLAPVVAALQALRGIGLISAVIIMAEIGDLCRFDNPRQLMGYPGVVPVERSTGNSVRRLGITKAGNGRVWRAPIESAWTYRHLPRTGPANVLQEPLPSAIKDIAAKVQTRLCARYRALSGKGKKQTVAVTALARELSGFVWAVGREVQTA